MGTCREDLLLLLYACVFRLIENEREKNKLLTLNFVRAKGTR